MTLWDLYLLLLSRVGLAPRPSIEDEARFTLPTFRAPSAASIKKFNPLHAWEWVGLPGAMLLAIIGELVVLNSPSTQLIGAVILLAGSGLFVLAVWRSALVVQQDTPAAVQPQLIASVSKPLTLVERSPILIAALSLSLITYLLVGDNNIPTFGFITWGASLVAWMMLFWETDSNWMDFLWRKQIDLRPIQTWINDQRLKIVSLWRNGVAVNYTATFFLFILFLLIAAYFRFYKLNEVPIEMTSDHVEKLVDSNDILNGARPIFEPANGGREPLAFYFVAFVANFNGLNHMTLKIVMSIAGFITLPFLFLIARELFEDDTLALLTMLLAGISWWANTISRNGLRFPFAPLLGAISLWLMIAALKRRRRNLALFAGLAFGIGLYGYTSVRVGIIALALVLVVYALHNSKRETWINAIKVFGVTSIIALAVYIPTVRYAVDQSENYWRRSLTRMLGDPSLDTPPPPLLPTLARNEWNSLTMFFSSADSAWLVSPAGQPALDWVMSACFLLGIAVLIYRYIRWRDWRDLFLLLSIPILLLPSTLALALPDENPSLHRSGMALLVVFVIIAIPLKLVLQYGRKLSNDWRGTFLGATLVGLLIFVSAQVNWNIFFVRYAKEYSDSVQNASELGGVVRAWATTTGSWETVIVRAYPYWVDTRSVGIYSGNFSWNNVILDGQPIVPEKWQNDPRAKLYILNRHDSKTIAELRGTYPQGVLTYQTSNFHDKDYLTFFVPGSADFNENTLLPKQP